jgi:hypothetical protein
MARAIFLPPVRRILGEPDFFLIVLRHHNLDWTFHCRCRRYDIVCCGEERVSELYEYPRQRSKAEFLGLRRKVNAVEQRPACFRLLRSNSILEALDGDGNRKITWQNYEVRCQCGVGLGFRLGFRLLSLHFCNCQCVVGLPLTSLGPGPAWPSLISVSLAPLSYFFCANADESRKQSHRRRATHEPTNPRTHAYPYPQNISLLKSGAEFLPKCGKKEGRLSAAFRTTVVQQPSCFRRA